MPKSIKNLRSIDINFARLQEIRKEAEKNIPTGYKIVTKGKIRANDFLWRIVNRTWQFERYGRNPGIDVKNYHLVIRKKNQSKLIWITNCDKREIYGNNEKADREFWDIVYPKDDLTFDEFLNRRYIGKPKSSSNWRSKEIAAQGQVGVYLIPKDYKGNLRIKEPKKEPKIEESSVSRQRKFNLE